MPPRVTAIHPRCAIEGGRITIDGADFPIDEPTLPEVRVGDAPARVVFASPTRLGVIVPAGLESGRATVRVAGVAGATLLLDVAAPFATGLHQVDNPVFDRDGNLYVTYSGSRGQQVPVSIFRVRPNGTRESFSSGIVNPTSMAIGPDDRLYVSSRFEGTVYRVAPDGSVEPFATDLGVACGLAFAADGALFVGDRSGTIFRVDRDGKTKTIATLPPSIAAFHLAVSRDRALYVTGPTLSSYDALYRVDPDRAGGVVTTRHTGFGRPQGLAFDARGDLYVIEALAGASGLYRMPPQGEPEMVLAGPGLVGVAFDSLGTLVVSSNETAYRLTGGVLPA
ncbi:MAG: SMP-30/gluconolactonase/LRE family protein [Acidobacteria bacterium]|nr:SMP-30/gluconolactonase/LRE family protein [Acidobacteriota bacterium]